MIIEPTGGVTKQACEQAGSADGMQMGILLNLAGGTKRATSMSRNSVFISENLMLYICKSMLGRIEC